MPKLFAGNKWSPFIPMTQRLSKSKFLAGRQCLKRLYYLHHGSVLRPEPDEVQKAKLAEGQQVGRLATQAFPGGVWVEGEYFQVREAVAQTQALLADDNVPAIFEPAFIFDDVLVRVDVLERLPGNCWRLIEVKASNSVKDYHYPDVAVQKYVLDGCGLKPVESCLMHLNRDYVYDGQDYDLHQLFIRTELSPALEDFSADIPDNLAAQRQALAAPAPPKIEPGKFCQKPYPCEFISYCQPKEPVVAGAQVSISGELPDVLQQLRYPLYFMDFETYGPALPILAGMRPYEPIPFQWSVHVQRHPGAGLEHYEFLAVDPHDPRENFLDSLLKVVEDAGGEGHIIVYHRYEEGRLNDLIRWLPSYASRIEKVKIRLWDLHQVLKSHVQHPGFGGSYSLKSVLPVLIPRMSYEGMEIAAGLQASLAYATLRTGELGEAEFQKFRQNLLAYCCQDTLAMFELIKSLGSQC
jgi:predicted RecB family nuclease